MHPFAFGDSEKKRTFFSERDKKLTTFYQVVGILGGFFLVLWISNIFFTETQNGWRRNGSAFFYLLFVSLVLIGNYVEIS